MPTNKVTTLTLESIDLYHNWCIGRGQSENTAKAYSTDLRMMLEFYQIRSIPMTQFEAMSTNWLNQTRKSAAPKTTGRRLTSLRGFARWVKLPIEDLLDYRAPIPAKQLPHPIAERLEGLKALEKVAWNDQLRAVVGCGGYIGLRISETLAFHVSWLDVNTMMLRVRGKGDKERMVPVSDRAWRSIRNAYIAAALDDGYLVHYQDRSARKAITVMGVDAGLALPLSSHDLRATYATILSDRGTPIRVIQELLGHANVTTTEVYTEVKLAALTEAVKF